MFSIVIPVYNIEKYIEKCVTSVQEQSYINFEIVLVDDGSTDSSGNICDDLAKKDKRIRVIHKKNGGLSEARNTGIDFSKGEYVIFLDGDDWWRDNNALSDLNKIIQEDTVDIVQFFFCKYYSNGKIIEGKRDYGAAFNGEYSINMLKKYIEKDVFSGATCDKAFKLDFLNKNLGKVRGVGDCQDMYDILVKYQPQFTEAYEKKMRLVMLEYESAVYMLVTNLSMILANNMEVVSNGTEIRIKAKSEETFGTIPKMRVFAVEKIIAGGKPIAFTKSVSKKLNTTANEP